MDWVVIGAILVILILACSISNYGSKTKSETGEFDKTIRIATSTLSRMQNPFKNIGEVQAALQKSGLESSDLIVGVDFTKSNIWAGKYSFNGLSLHDISRKGVENPYQRVMRIIAKTLPAYDDDLLIPVFGFGDIYTAGTSCFPFYPDRPCHGLDEVLHNIGPPGSQLQFFFSPKS